MKKGITMWAMMAFFSFFQFFMQISGNLMESAWQNAFHINQTMVGFLSSSFFYGYILVQIPAGFFFDAIGMKKVIRIAVSLFVFGMILLTATSSIYCGLLGRLMMGSGAGFAFIAMVYSAASWFGPALLTAFVGMGEMLSMLLTAGAQAGTPILILHYGWRMVLSGFILMGLIFLILVFRFLENPPHHQKCTTKIWPLFKSHWQTVVKTPNVWIAGLYCCGLFSVITVFASLWANPYLQLRYHLDYLSASHFIAWVPLGFGLGCPILGAINERFISHKRLMILQAALLFCFSLVMMYAGTHLFLLGLSLFCMGFLGGGNVIGFYIAERSVAPDVRGIAIGLCNAITIFGAIVFQPLIGLLWPHFGVHTMLVFPGLLLLSCVMTLIYKNKPTL